MILQLEAKCLLSQNINIIIQTWSISCDLWCFVGMCGHRWSRLQFIGNLTLTSNQRQGCSACL